MRPFYLFQRSKVFYVQFVNPSTRLRLCPLSTRKKNRDEALVTVYEWLEKGVPSKQSKKAITFVRPVTEKLSTAQVLEALKKAELTVQDVPKIERILQGKELVTLVIGKDTPCDELLEEYLRRFWDYEKSPYVEEKKSHKISISLNHTLRSLERVNLYWVPYFKGKKLGEITRQNIKDFSNDLVKKYPNRSPLTLKQIVRVGVTALRWAYANEKIPIDPTTDLPSYSSKSRKRGVLTPKEAQELFQLDWKDKRAMLVNLTAMTTGLRIGEILALHKEDIGEEYLTIQWSYSLIDGLKSTKTEEPRSVPVIPQIRDALRLQAGKNPHGDGFVFFGEKPNKPWDQHYPLKALKKMLVRMKAGEHKDEKVQMEKDEEAEKYWQKRNVVFHSWRHFYAARMADKLEARKVMLATGHKTEAVFRGYADHALENDLNEVAVTTGEVFKGIVPKKIEIPEKTAKKQSKKHIDSSCTR